MNEPPRKEPTDPDDEKREESSGDDQNGDDKALAPTPQGLGRKIKKWIRHLPMLGGGGGKGGGSDDW